MNESPLSLLVKMLAIALVIAGCSNIAMPASASTIVSPVMATLPASTLTPTIAPSLSPTLTRERTSFPTLAGIARVEIFSHQEWQSAGIIVQAGQSITVQASGDWKHAESEASYGPGGIERIDTNSVLPSAPVGSLIARIGRGKPFEIGTRTLLTADKAGPLQLSMNDSTGMFGDNQGALVVQLGLNTCGDGWSRLSVGAYAVVAGESGDRPNRVRADPDTSAEVLTQLYPGSIVRVLNGPVCAEDLVFWNVESEAIPGGAGWTAEGDERDYYLEPHSTLANDANTSPLVIAGGTYFDHGAGLMGTGFVFPSALADGKTIVQLDIQGPSGWNANNVFQLYPYQPPRIAQERAIGWVFAEPVSGVYTATAEVSSGPPVSTTIVIDISSQLPAPIILSAEGSPSEVKVEWSATSEMDSFLLRLEQEPFTSAITETLVPGKQREMTFSGLALKSGVAHRVVIFAFSNDLYTPGALASPANLSAHVSETFIP